MTTTIEQVKEVMQNSIGSMTFFKRNGSQYMDYTEGVMYFQTRLNAYWFVDMVYSHMPAVIKDYDKTEETFYMVDLIVNEDNSAVFTITREVYDESDDGYHEEVIAQQDIPYVDLPPTKKGDIRFYLELAGLEPTLFRLLLPMEH